VGVLAGVLLAIVLVSAIASVGAWGWIVETVVSRWQ